MLALRRYIFRRQCALVLVIFFLFNFLVYFLTFDLTSFPKWSVLSWGGSGKEGELALLVRHLETEMENHIHSYKKRERKKRQPRSCKHKYKLVVVVQSKTSNFDRRNIIRSTWGDRCTKCRRKKWIVFFLTGTSLDPKEAPSLKEEGEEHGDLIPVDTVDSMRNITDKLKKGFTWASTHCRFSYMLKTNDNTFVNIPTLYQFLQHPQTPQQQLYAGNVNWWQRVLRDGIYGVGPEYKRDFYPRYCSGAAYVLSHDAVLQFVSNFNKVGYLFIEDAYIGEVALRSGIDVVHSKSFLYAQSGCAYNSSYISYHPVNTADCMMKMFQQTLPLFVSVYN